jgi:hypothetical protein
VKHNGSNLTDKRRTKKGIIESGFPARSKQKSEEDIRDIRGRRQKPEVKSFVYVVQ